MLHAKISGIPQLELEVTSKLASISTIEYVQIDTEAALKLALNTCDIFWFRLNHKLTKVVLKDVRCKYILCAVTGLDHIDLEACKQQGITVISLKNEFEFLKEVRATAEHTWGLLLSLIRHANAASKHVQLGGWDRTLFQGTELYKKKLGILGLGRLGDIVASYGHAFGMEVYYFDNDNIKTSNTYIKCETPEELLNTVDILSIHLPYNEVNHEIVNAHYYNAMKQGMLIINTSRGGLVDENALINAMKLGVVKGYATDVLYGEPDIENNPIFRYSKQNRNILITPHIGGNTIESIQKTEAFIIDKLLESLKQNTKDKELL